MMIKNELNETFKSRQNISTGIDMTMRSGGIAIDHNPGKSIMKKSKIKSYQTSFQVDNMNQSKNKIQD